MINYIEQIKRFWIAQEANQLGTNEVAMYFYLLEICNMLHWTDTFKRNNAKIVADLSISFKTLQSTRNKLQQAGLITFKTQNGVPNVSYSIVDLCKNSKGQGRGQGRGQVQGSGRGSGQDNKNKTKPNETSISHTGAALPVDEKNKTPFWKILVDDWFIFYEKKFSVKPSFTGTDATSLKSILTRLKKTNNDAGNEWTEDVARRSLQRFLNLAYQHDWLRNNFLLKNLSSHYDTIVLPKKEFNGTNRQNNSNGGSKIGAKSGGFALISEAFKSS